MFTLAYAKSVHLITLKTSIAALYKRLHRIKKIPANPFHHNIYLRELF